MICALAEFDILRETTILVKTKMAVSIKISNKMADSRKISPGHMKRLTYPIECSILYVASPVGS